MAEPIIQVESLYKSYGAVEAVRGLSFAVEEGEVFGLLGPNGAGKTTTVEILEGMRTPDRGIARVCGLDPEKSGSEFKQKIGAVLQSTSLPDKLRVKEAIDLFANFYTDRADTEFCSSASSSKKSAPPFTASFPAAKNSASRWPWRWSIIRRSCFSTSPPPASTRRSAAKFTTSSKKLKRDKKTVLITTHYIEEAERLCDRVAIVDHGRIIKTGTPRELKHCFRRHHAHRSPPRQASDQWRAHELSKASPIAANSTAHT